MSEKQLEVRFVAKLLLFVVPVALLLVCAAIHLSDVMVGGDRTEVLASPEAHKTLESLLQQHWKLNLTQSAGEVEGAIQHPGGVALGEWGETGWFSVKSPKPDVLVRSLISSAREDSRMKENGGLSFGALDHGLPNGVPGWWNPGSPPSDLLVFEVDNGDPLWLGYSKGLSMVYFKLMW